MKRIAIIVLMLLPFALSAGEKNRDWANVGRYAGANAELARRPFAVLFGDSITDVWASKDSAFFTGNNLVGRGISGQTTSQILVRMQCDVVALKPKYVVILCGINDIALNPGHAVDAEAAVANIKSMCDIARAHKIRPVLCTLLPSYNIKWRKDLGDVLAQVQEYNSLIVAYAAVNRLKVVDYYSLFADGEGRMPRQYSSDTVHPNMEGYRLMEECLMKVLK